MFQEKLAKDLIHAMVLAFVSQELQLIACHI